MEEGRYYRLWYRDDANLVRERIVQFRNESGCRLNYEMVNKKMNAAIHKDSFIRAEEISGDEALRGVYEKERNY